MVTPVLCSLSDLASPTSEDRRLTEGSPLSVPASPGFTPLHSGLTSRHHITESQRSPQVDNIVLDVYLVNFKYTVTEYTFDNQTVRDWDGLNQDKI